MLFLELDLFLVLEEKLIKMVILYLNGMGNQIQKFKIILGFKLHSDLKRIRSAKYDYTMSGSCFTKSFSFQNYRY